MFISMEFKRLAFSESFIWQRRKVISGLSFGIGASLVIFAVVLLNNSLGVPKVEPFLQGFDAVGVNSSFASSPFSFSSNTSSSSSKGNVANTSELQNPVSSLHRAQEVSSPGVRRNDTADIDRTQLGNSTNYRDDENMHVEGQRVQQKSHEGDGALVAGKGNFSDSNNGQGIGSGKSGEDDSLELVKDVSLLDEEGRITENANLSDKAKTAGQKTIEGEPPTNANFNSTISNAAGNNNVTGNFRGYPVEKNNATVFYDGSLKKKKQNELKNCDIYDGKWVRDNSKPYYRPGSCPYIDESFDCHRNGRPDREYVKWRWHPNGCAIPRLNAIAFLERLRGQKLVFVGDSLNRNMWESLVCLLRQSIKNKKHVYEISGRSQFKKRGVYAFRFEEYNCSVDFVASPFLVREWTFKGKNGTYETLRLDLMDQTTTMYKDADIIVFNTGHWWTHEKTSKGEDYYQEGNYVYPRLEVVDAYARALTTWARWVDKNIDSKRTQVFFRGYSRVHFSGGQWNSGGQCHKETEPIFNETYLRSYPSKMKAVENVIKTMKTPVLYMNISRLTDYRKDAHPSIYRLKYKTEAERIAAGERFQDCSHWCLPGVPDAWNELLYASLLKYGKGTWKT
ncbi:hypothetical protein L6164_027275 [Bauhinia variegata]|uniref:Uncharacterized protein n=1 Tax=Bauhinia variegata TaxID=167791 RepID=A0ACB9LTK8_BAUVA|nr:hypothetical protein L6164_027275 [Bauhinia variegata]